MHTCHMKKRNTFTTKHDTKWTTLRGTAKMEGIGGIMMTGTKILLLNKKMNTRKNERLLMQNIKVMGHMTRTITLII